MSSSNRVWILSCLTMLMTLGFGPVIAAQDREPAKPVGPDGELVPSEVEGRTTILTLKPAGSLVEKGDLVCELDSAEYRDNLKMQTIAILGAEAGYKNARLTREVAELAVKEFKDEINKASKRESDKSKLALSDRERDRADGMEQELETIKGEILLADAELKRAEDRLEWSNRMHEKGFVSKAQNVADRVSLQQKIFACEQARTKLKVLVGFFMRKSLKQLESEFEKARAEEEARRAALETERNHAGTLKRQIENCKVLAPSNGRIRYFPTIEPGATVKENQLLFRVVPAEAK